MKRPAPKRRNAGMPLYLQAKAYVIEQIAAGRWRADDRVITELELARRFKISRMTANRAMAELAQEGYIIRRAGQGSFVADRRPHGHLVEVHDIAHEIAGRGHQHSCRVLAHRTVKASAALARDFGVVPGAKLYRSLVVHLEDAEPIQLEDRHVNPRLAPDYIDLDLNRRTAADYLLQQVPLAQAEHVVSATLPTARTARVLKMAAGEPCLLLHRRTWSQGTVASIADLFHPGSRYDLVGRFKP